MSNFPVSIRIAKLREWAILPTRKHSDDAGLDLFYCPSYDKGQEYIPPEDYIPEHKKNLVGSGIAVAIPKGIVGIVTRCSGTEFSVETGVIDAGYTGEIIVRIRTDKTIILRAGQKIAQLLLIPIWTPNLHEIQYDEFPKTERGANGGIVKSFKDVG